MTDSQAPVSPSMACGMRLVDLCKAGDFNGAMEACYGEDIVSVEPLPEGTPGAIVEGLAGVREKAAAWYESNEVHSCAVEGPFPHGDRFAVTFDLDVTSKAGPMAGQRIRMKEVGLYTVRDGKVVREEFFYSMG